MENDPDQFRRVFYSKGKHIFKRMGGDDEFVINVKDIPITYKGMLSHNIPNVMTALAAFEGIKRIVPISRESLENTLRNFGNRASDNFSRFTMVIFKGEKVILGFSKNPESYRREIEIIKKTRNVGKFVNVVDVLTAVGDRQQKYYKG